jgi:hypothetical protein
MVRTKKKIKISEMNKKIKEIRIKKKTKLPLSLLSSLFFFFLSFCLFSLPSRTQYISTYQSAWCLLGGDEASINDL